MSKQIETSLDAQNAQIVGYRSYAIKGRNSDILTRIDSEGDDHFLNNEIRIRSTDHKCPTIWKKGTLTATQIIEGKTSKKMMCQQKLVLTLVENDHRIWFEVACLRNDLTYPFSPEQIGVRVFPFKTYKKAKAKLVSLVNWTKRATKTGKAKGTSND